MQAPVVVWVLLKHKQLYCTTFTKTGVFSTEIMKQSAVYWLAATLLIHLFLDCHWRCSSTVGRFRLNLKITQLLLSHEKTRNRNDRDILRLQSVSVEQMPTMLLTNDSNSLTGHVPWGHECFGFQASCQLQVGITTQHKCYVNKTVHWNTNLCQYNLHYNNTCLVALGPGLPRWAGTRKVKPACIFCSQNSE